MVIQNAGKLSWINRLFHGCENSELIGRVVIRNTIYNKRMKGNFMKKECTVYIDEAGDLGINRGTQWFVLSAIIVDKDAEPSIRKKIATIKSELNLKEIHFRNLRNFEQKCYVVSHLSTCEFDLINVVVDTTKLNLNRTDRNGTPSIVSYNYCCRLLLERASWLLRDTERMGDIVLSSRGTSRDNELIEYIDRLQKYDFNEVKNCFNKIKAKSAAEWDLLQLADVCATSIFYYHEANRYGFITPCFCYRLNKHVYERNSKTDSYGMKYFDSKMKPSKDYFLSKMICK